MDLMNFNSLKYILPNCWSQNPALMKTKLSFRNLL